MRTSAIASLTDLSADTRLSSSRVRFPVLIIFTSHGNAKFFPTFLCNSQYLTSFF